MLEKIVAGLVVLFLLMVACSGAAYPQSATQCAPYANLQSHLAEKYGEAMVWQGSQSPETVVQVWSNAATETWTIVVYKADGMGCMVASGTGLETFAPPPAGTEG